MILKRIKVQMKFVGETNCYILIDEIQKKAMVIDPAGNVDKIITILDNLGAKLEYIYLTHCHADHINGVNELKKERGGKVLIHRKGRENLENRVPVLAEYIGLPPIYVKEVNRLYSTNFTFEDAWSLDKSLTMFNLMNNHYNPTKNIDEAIKLHNPGAGKWYSDRIKQRMKMIKFSEEVRTKLKD